MSLKAQKLRGTSRDATPVSPFSRLAPCLTVLSSRRNSFSPPHPCEFSTGLIAVLAFLPAPRRISVGTLQRQRRATKLAQAGKPGNVIAENPERHRCVTSSPFLRHPHRATPNFKLAIASAQRSLLPGRGQRLMIRCQFNRDRGGLNSCASYRKQRAGYAFNRNKFEPGSSMQYLPSWIEYPVSRPALPQRSHQALPFTNHHLPLTTHRLSNRHKRGLETPVSPCVFNKSDCSNRHRFGGWRFRD